MSATRRRADGSWIGPATHESLVDRLVREARERGEWDESAFRGRPLPRPDDEAYAGDMALANRIMRNAGVAPPWIEADKAVRRLAVVVEQTRAQLARATGWERARLERRLEQQIVEHDRAVEVLEGLAPTARQQRPRLAR
jgi:DnaJ homolog subfamily C member 28